MRSRNFKQDYRQLLALTDSVPVIVWSCLLVALLAVAPLLLSKYYVSVILLLLITAVGVLGLNLLTGTTGLISLGHSGFLAVGAYTAGIVAGKLGWPMLAAIFAGGVSAAIAGIAEAATVLRQQGSGYDEVVAQFHRIIAAYSPMGDDVNHSAAKAGVATAAYQPSRLGSIEELPLALGFARFLGNRPSFQLGLDLFGGLGGARQKTKCLAKPRCVDLGGVILTAPHPERDQVHKPQGSRKQQQNCASGA